MVIKIPNAGLSLGKNPLNSESGMAELEGCTLRDEGIIEPLPGFGNQQATGSTALVRSMATHQDELHGEHLVWVDDDGNLSVARTSDIETQGTLSDGDGEQESVLPLSEGYNTPAIAQVNEHTTLVATRRKTVAVRPASDVEESELQEAGLPELTTALARLDDASQLGWLATNEACVYRAALTRSYGDRHTLESAPSGRGIVRNSFILPAGSITRSTATITITCTQPHGLTATGTTLVLEPDDGPFNQDDNITPGPYTVASITSEYAFTVTAAYGSSTATSTKTYRVYFGTVRSSTRGLAGANITEASNILTVNFGDVHGLTSTTYQGWQLRLYQVTGQSADANFEVGLYPIASVVSSTTLTASGFSSGTNTSAQPYYVALIPPAGTQVPDQLNPSSNATFRRVMIDVPIPSNGGFQQRLQHTSALGIDAGSAWTRTAVSAVNVVSSVYPGRGTVSAAELVDKNATQLHGLVQGSLTIDSSQTATWSIAVKRAASPTTRRIGLMATGPSSTYVSAVFDLVDGTVITAVSSATARITDEGGGWYRCALVGTFATGSVGVYLLDDSEADTYDGSSSWNYAGTASKSVYVEGPRLFWGSPVRTNYLTYSQDFSQSAWSPGNMDLISNSTQAVPVLGSVLVNRVGYTGGSTPDNFSLRQNGRNGGVSTLSVYAKAGTGVTRVGLALTDSTTYYSAVFDLTSVRVVTLGAGCSAAIVDVGSSWRRLELTAPAADSVNVHLLSASETDEFPNWETTPTTNDYFDLAGLQLEHGVGSSAYKVTTTAPVSASVHYDGQYVPPARAGDVLTLYRSTVIEDDSGTLGPGDDCYGVATFPLIDDDLYEGRVRFLEKASSDKWGPPLYTNPTDGAVENAPNTKPPVGDDVCEWDGRAWLCNVVSRPRMSLTILGTTGTGLVVGDTFILSRDDTYERRAFTAVAPGTTRPGSFAVHTAGSVSENIELTARDLVRAINLCEPCTIKAYYVGSDFTAVGQLALETKDIGSPDDSPGFSFDVLDSNGRRKRGPITLPAPGTESDNAHAHNTCAYSKAREHEAWPILNTKGIGPRQNFTRRIFGFRDRLYAFGRLGGVWVVVGPYPYRTLGPISSAKLLGSRCVCEFGDNVWALTDQGLGYITDSGFVVASIEVERDWRDLLGPQGQAESALENAFMVADDAAGLLYVWVPSVLDGSTVAATIAYVYNAKTRTWSTWERSADAACLSRSTGDIWAGCDSCLTGTARQLATIRREGTSDDNADLEVDDLELTLSAGKYWSQTIPLPAGTKLVEGIVNPDWFYFPLDEDAGSAIDSVHAYSLAAGGNSAGTSSAKVQLAREFTTDFVFPNDVGQQLSGTVGSGWTLSDWALGFWIRPADIDFGSAGRAAHLIRIDASGAIIDLEVVHGGALRFAYSGVLVGNVTTLSLNTWAFVVIEKESNAFRYYINGALASTVITATGTLGPLGTTTLTIGNQDSGAGGWYPYQGRCDEFWMQTTGAVGEAIVAELYEAQSEGERMPGTERWIVNDALVEVPLFGYGPIITERGTDGTEETFAGTVQRAVLPVPAAIQWHPIDAGDVGLRKQFSQWQAIWSEETELDEALVNFAARSGDFGSELVLPETPSNGLSRIEPIPRAAAATNALKVRLRIQQAQRAWRLFGTRVEIAAGTPGKGHR